MKKEQIEKAITESIERKRQLKEKVKAGYYKDFKTIRII